jgi:Ca2+-binding RTX toxin-like protein
MSVTVGDFNINGLDIFLTSLTTGKYLTGNITYSFNSGAILPRIVNVNDQTISNNAVDFLAEHTNQVTVKNISENEALVDNIKAGIEMITRFAGVNISESSDPSTSYIYITETDLVYEYDPIWNNTKGSGNYPLTPNNGAIVTFSTDNTQYDTNPTASAVSFTEWAILHEMLHTLGLYHPQESFSGKGSVPESLQDIRFSVMNYYNGFDHYENHADYGWAITPMPMDIAVLQKLYGEVANNTGNTTYYWDLITRDLQGNDDSVRMGRGLYAIWDTSGDDTIDFSNNSGRALINLNGATLNSTTVPNEVADMRTALQQSTGWSTLLNYAKEEILSDAAAYGGYLSSVMLTSGFGNGGFVIANQSASSQYDSGVENAIGSSFDDLLIGNAKQNTQNGGAGNDLIYGGSNNDTLIGGAGTDELLGGEGDDLLVGGTGSDILNGGRDSDTADYSSKASRLI